MQPDAAFGRRSGRLGVLLPAGASRQGGSQPAVRTACAPSSEVVLLSTLSDAESRAALRTLAAAFREHRPPASLAATAKPESARVRGPRALSSVFLNVTSWPLSMNAHIARCLRPRARGRGAGSCPLEKRTLRHECLRQEVQGRADGGGASEIVMGKSGRTSALRSQGGELDSRLKELQRRLRPVP